MLRAFFFVLLGGYGRTAESPTPYPGGSLGVPKRSHGYGVWASGYAAKPGGGVGEKLRTMIASEDGLALRLPRSPQACQRLPPRLRGRVTRRLPSGGRGTKGVPSSGRPLGGEVIPSTETHGRQGPLTAEDYDPAFRLVRKASSAVILLSGLSGKLPQL